MSMGTIWKIKRSWIYSSSCRKILKRTVISCMNS